MAPRGKHNLELQASSVRKLVIWIATTLDTRLRRSLALPPLPLHQPEPVDVEYAVDFITGISELDAAASSTAPTAARTDNYEQGYDFVTNWDNISECTDDECPTGSADY